MSDQELLPPELATPPSDAGAPKPSRGRAARRALQALLLLLVGGVAAGIWAYSTWTGAIGPLDPEGAPVAFEVRPGATLRSVAEALEREGIVRHAWAVIGMARWRDLDGAVQAGEYELSPAWSVEEVLGSLVEGRVVTYEVSIPEGLTAVEIAARIEAAGLVDAAALVELANDPASAAAFGVEGPTLEGYLFPETYRMPRGLETEEVARVLVDHFLAVWREIEAEATLQELSMREVTTLASIVEKETGAAEERPLIASVFRNRLARGMRLESDPTTIYGLADFDGNLTRKHLEDESNPYNTYRIPGLTPTPIANPGADALRAVVRPADSEYLFFVSRNDGTHVFARTYAEHDRNVDRFQRRGR